VNGAIDLANKIGEIVEASTAGFTAQCYELHQPPPFGSLVRARCGHIEIYAVVSGAATASIEAGRRPVARGREEEVEEDVFSANPQLDKLLRTDFDGLVVGHRDGDKLNHYLPPQPAKIHSFVFLCEPDEVAAFNQSLDYLSILIYAEHQADELIAASLRHAATTREDSRDFLVGAGKELASFLADDTSRLNTILRRIRQ
jgi:hypothetical protein